MAKKHIKLLQQNGTETNVSSTLITKLYTLYDLAQRSSDVWDCDENSIKGSFNTTYTYDKYKTELVKKEGDSRLSPVDIEGSNFIIDMDYVVMAIGSTVDEKVVNSFARINDSSSWL